MVFSAIARRGNRTSDLCEIGSGRQMPYPGCNTDFFVRSRPSRTAERSEVLLVTVRAKRGGVRAFKWNFISWFSLSFSFSFLLFFFLSWSRLLNFHWCKSWMDDLRKIVLFWIVRTLGRPPSAPGWCFSGRGCKPQLTWWRAQILGPAPSRFVGQIFSFKSTLICVHVRAGKFAGNFS